ncbi:MAG: GNAT family N-acetyltransferase [Coriobacteriia bacterium]|nr:GNAT family N-acetyltransferase [Coriobacteriia bacterium]
MRIIYKDTQEFRPEELQELFLSVAWSSAEFPERLVCAMNNSGSVFSAWDGEHLIGLINALDDGDMTAYVHFLLVNPKYQQLGIGRKLVSLVKERYVGYLRIVLVGYDKKMRFYQECGFEPSTDSVPLFITTLNT